MQVLSLIAALGQDFISHFINLWLQLRIRIVPIPTDFYRLNGATSYKSL